VFFDAIVCDPPYGVRAGSRKTGANGEVKPIQPHQREAHIPGTVSVALPDVMQGLLELAANTLLPRGRLVYWLPVTPEYTDAEVPRHPCLDLIANSEQVLTMKLQRRLITMQRNDTPYQRYVAPEQSIEVSYNNLHDKILGINRTK